MLTLSALALIWLVWLLQLPPHPSAWLVCLTGLPLLALGSRLAARHAREPWGKFVRRTGDDHAVWLVLLFALGVQFADTHGITTDGAIYFTQLRSVLFDHDLDVAREFAYLQQPPRPAHVVPIGPVAVWLPLYLAVAAVDSVGRFAGWWPAPADPVAIGLTLPYVRAALVSSFAIGAAGVVVVHRLLRREFDRAAAFAATLLTIGATSLFWYLVYEPSMTHAASFGFVALFVMAAARRDARTARPRDMVIVGVLLGLAFIARPQEAVFVLLPAVAVLALPEPFMIRLRAAGRSAMWGFIGFAPFVALQLVHSYILFSRERLVLVGEQGFLSPFRSRWSETLWSSWHGFFSWTPIAYIALIATIVYGFTRRGASGDVRRRRGVWAIVAVLTVFAMAWINGATPDLGAGWSFGGRRFVSCLVLLAPGLALLAEKLIARPMASLAAITAAAVAWNVLLARQYRDGLLPPTAPISFSQIVEQQAGLYTKPPYFYPFAFPANALFAWRTGLPIDRYDLLAPEPLVATIDLPLQERAGKFLLDGWEQIGSAWWTAASPATLVLPLRLPEDRDVRVEVEARARLTDAIVRAPITVIVNGQPAGSFVAEAQTSSTGTFTTPKHGVWIDGFNRVSFVSGDRFWPVAIYRVAVTPIESR